jgi:hypothetical protein
LHKNNEDRAKEIKVVNQKLMESFKEKSRRNAIFTRNDFFRVKTKNERKANSCKRINLGCLERRVFRLWALDLKKKADDLIGKRLWPKQLARPNETTHCP